MQLSGAVGIVTGASSGIGAATAVELARRGVRVVAVARRSERLAETVAASVSAGGQAVAVSADVTDPDSVPRVVEAAEASFGPVDLLVNNAGISIHKTAIDTGIDEAIGLFEIHVFAPMRFTAAVLPGMLSRHRGAIVNVTSVSAYVPAPKEAAYGAAKAALSRWSHGLAVELAGTGVHVSVVSPGPIETEIWEHVDRYYKGRLFPASVVARAIADAAARGTLHVSAPRRFGAAAAVYPLMGRPFRWGVRQFERRL
jgi:short-subunit dehydrogenase